MEVINGGYKTKNNMNIDNENITETTEITDINCPECKESLRMIIKDYKIKLYDCKNGHSKDNILLDEFEEIQNSCKTQLKCNNIKCGNIQYNSQLYECVTCGIILCKNCKKKHDNKHTIININKCKLHNEYYDSYCTKCKINLCPDCDHKCESIKSYRTLKETIELENIDNKIKDLKTRIDETNEIINHHINILNNVKMNFNNYYKIHPKR